MDMSFDHDRQNAPGRNRRDKSEELKKAVSNLNTSVSDLKEAAAQSRWMQLFNNPNVPCLDIQTENVNPNSGINSPKRP